MFSAQRKICGNAPSSVGMELARGEPENTTKYLVVRGSIFSGKLAF